MGNNENREETGGEVTNGGDKNRGTVSNANASDVRWWVTTSKCGGIRGYVERRTRVQKPKRTRSTIKDNLTAKVGELTSKH